MTDSEQLHKIATRQESLIVAMNGLAGAMETNTETLSELMAWLREPPSSALPDLIIEMTKALKELRAEVAALGKRM